MPGSVKLPNVRGILAAVVLGLCVGAGAQSGVSSSQWLALGKAASAENVALSTADLPNDAGIQIDLSTPGAHRSQITLQDGEDYDALNVPGCGVTAEAFGQPALPFKGFFLEVPYGVDLDVELADGAVVSLGTGFKVGPLQPPPPDIKGVIVPFEKDAAAYRTNAFFPQEVVSVEGPAFIRGRRVVFVKVSPLQYNPVTTELRGYASVRLVLHYEGASSFGAADGESRKARLASPVFESLAQQNIVNYEPVSPTATQETDLATGDGADYLIITADAYMDEVLPLAEWKHRKGYQTRLVSMSEVGTDHLDIMAYLQDAYDTWDPAPTFVLLAGDQEQVPGYEMVGHPYHGDDEIWPSDNPYACVDGPEFYTPDLIIGRLFPADEAEAALMVNKVLTYDRTPDLGGWYDDFLGASYFQDYDNNNYVADRFFMEGTMLIYDFLVNEVGFTGHTALCTDYWPLPSVTWRFNPRELWYPHREELNMERWGVPYPDPVPTWITDMWTSPEQATLDVSTAVNGGVGLALHHDHGNVTLWGDPRFTVSDVDALTNGVKTPVVINISCLTGAYDDPQGCLTEAWLRHPNGGAVGAVAASRVAYSGTCDLLANGMIDGLYPQYDTTYGDTTVPNSMRPAQAMVYGKYYMKTFVGTGSSSEVTYELFHWFGDPEMYLRTTTPQVLTVTHPTVVSAFVPADVAVTVESGGSPVEGALVALTHPTAQNQHWTGLTDATGTYSFTNTTFTEVGTYDLVVSGQNLYPYEGTVTTTYSSEGAIAFVDDVYACSDSTTITVSDADLTGQGTQDVTVVTTSGDSETLSLSEGTPGIFSGSISLACAAPSIDDGIAQVAHGDTITATYEDLDNGSGSPATVQATAAADCQGPVISNVQGAGAFNGKGTITFDTDEPATTKVRVGLACGTFTLEEEDTSLGTAHSYTVSGLELSTAYYFEVEAVDGVGNQTIDDNVGACYTFSTFGLPGPPFCDDFESGNLDFWVLNAGGSGDTPLVRLDKSPYEVTPISGSYVAYLGDSTNFEASVSTLDLALDLSRYDSAELSFYWAPHHLSVSTGQFLRLDVYDGAWHTDVIGWAPSGVGWTYNEVDLSPYNLIDGFTIRFIATMHYREENDAAYIDDVCVVADLADDLRVAPRVGLDATGPQGGPFAPGSFTCTLTNIGTAPLDWSAAGMSSWLDVAPTSGTLAASASTNVVLTLNAVTQGLAIGGHTDTVTFTNTTSGVTRQRDVDLTVSEPLEVTPATDLESTGPQGGPFTPPNAVYTLTNLGDGTFSWSASPSHVWFDVTPASGTLTAGGTVDVTVAFTAAAGSLLPGEHTGAVTFTNTTSGYTDDRSVTLTVTEALEITPATGLESTGPQGGPFTPPNAVYTLTNLGNGSIPWSIAASDTWFEATPASGTLAGGGTVDVTVALATAAESLAPGAHSGTVTLTNDSSGHSDERSVALTVSEALEFTPATPLAGAGPQGGPFTPPSAVYTLTNLGNGTFSWSAVASDTWFEATPASGTLAGSGAVDVTIAFAGPAETLPPGDYSGTVTLTNDTSGYSEERLVELTVSEPLGITPATALESAGPQGGPFAPASATYTLTNLGNGTFSWTATPSATWFDVTPASGTLTAGGTVDVTVALTAEPETFTPGTFSGSVVFEDLVSGGSEARGVELEVRPVDAFVWDAVASPQEHNIPFSARIRAVDALGETVRAFDGSVQLRAFTPGGPAASCIVITEVDLSEPDAIEVQNVSRQTVNTAGWLVAVSNDSASIDAVNAVYWTLPDFMAPGEILYQTDEASTNYWGADINWANAEAGWAMILDDTRAIVDFVAWGWSGTAIAGMAPVIDGSTVTIGAEWGDMGVGDDGGSGSIQRLGGTDENQQSDFAWFEPKSFGGVNAMLMLPFVETGVSFPAGPTGSGPFTEGVWVGDMTAFETGTGISLVADESSGFRAVSNAFDVVPPASPIVTNVTSTTPDGTYTTASAIDIQVVFSAPVHVSTPPSLILETGSGLTTAPCLSGDGTATLTFQYTVAAGDYSAGLSYENAYALLLNGAAITHALSAESVADHTLPLPGETGSLSANKAIVIDTLAPAVGVDFLTTNDTTPALTGTVDDPGATVQITVDGQVLTATNNADGTWTLADDLLTPLAEGTYEVLAEATDGVGNAATDSTSGELTIDLTPPIILVDSILTNDPTPALSSAINDTAATIQVTVDGQVRNALNNGDGTWTLPDNMLGALAEGVYDVQAVATDLAGNVGVDTTADELTIDLTAPAVTVAIVATNQTAPELTGMVDDAAASVELTVDGQVLPATNNGDGTWILASGALGALAEGVYDIQVAATDLAGNVGTDTTSGELTIDLTAPNVTVDAMVTNDTTPQLTGTVDDPAATVQVTVDGQTLPATNNGDETWTLADDALTPLAEGTYDVLAEATDVIGNAGVDATVDELTIDLTAPAVGVDSLTTSDTTPQLTGAVDDPAATVQVTVGGQALLATNSGDGTWTLADDVLTALAEGTYDVLAVATDLGGNAASDGTVDELVVDTTAPTASLSLDGPAMTSGDMLSFTVTFSEGIGFTFNEEDVVLLGSLAGAASVTIESIGQAYIVTVTTNDPNDDGTLGIRVAGFVADRAGNVCIPAESALCAIHNWFGFEAPLWAGKFYSHDGHLFTVSPRCGNSTPHYQWKWDDGDGKAIHAVGSDSPVLALTDLSTDQAGSYWCEVAYDGHLYATNTPVVEVADHLVLTNEPEGGDKHVGDEHTFAVEAEGGYEPLTYVWKKDGGVLPGLTEASWSLDSLVEADTGAYTVEVADANSDVVESDPAGLAVTYGLPAGGLAALALLGAMALAAGAGALRKRR